MNTNLGTFRASSLQIETTNKSEGNLFRGYQSVKEYGT